jgi:CheY-like chemotaxis protein/anti-sigma regulatory factor (Ser/Thr protein kinase)
MQTALIDDILDVSRIMRGKINLTFRSVRMSTVVEAALAAVRPTADAKGVTLEYEMAADSDEIRGDADRLQQIVWNLLSNAIKFTPRDGRVIVRVERHDDDLTLAVRDTGQGISQDFLPHVFDRFSQAESGSTRTHGGLGLGLAIVRHLVELHAGSVEAASDGAGQGAAFLVRLPIKQSKVKTAGEDQGQTMAPAGKLEGVSILVVDDEPDSREVLAELLRQYGAQTRTASSAEEALAEIAHNTPQVLLSDIGMPSVDGYELVRRVREIIPETDMLAMALTGLGSAQDRKRALADGFQVCMVKPVEPEHLVEAIKQLLPPRQRSTQ